MNWNQIPRIPQRDGYGQGLLDLCAARPDVVVLDADVAASTRTNWVRDRFPDHFYNLGISEQDLVGTAAGLALGGQLPYVSTYGVFLSGRAFDQIRTTVCYNNLKVRFGGAHAGISVGPDGATHQALEDLALARVLPHMTVIAPCDSEQTRKAVLAAVDWPGPVYFRFGREAVPVITDETTPFTIGKARLVQRGRDCAVLACGAMVYEALVAAQALAAQGISLTVGDLHTIKPLRPPSRRPPGPAGPWSPPRSTSWPADSLGRSPRWWSAPARCPWRLWPSRTPLGRAVPPRP